MASASSAVGGDAADGVIEPTEPPFFRGDETCAVTSIVPAGYPSNCRQSRSCRSCLQKSGCMINQFGACVDQFSGRFSTWMNYSMAYSMDLVLPNATTTNPRAAYSSQYWAFRAFEGTYCPQNDPICQECIAQNFWSPLSRPDSRFCEGRNGCVCIFDCENHAYAPDVQCLPPTNTPSPTVANETMAKGLDSVIKIIVLGLCVLLLLFAACLFRCIRKDYDMRRRQDRQRREAHEARAELRAQQRQQRLDKLGVSALSLSGWQSFRQSLIEKEKQRLDGNDAAADPVPSPSATPYVLTIDEVGSSETSVPMANTARSSLRRTTTMDPTHSSVQ